MLTSPKSCVDSIQDKMQSDRAAKLEGLKMIKRILFAEIMQGFDALSSARKAETTLRTVKVKLKSAQKISANKLHANEGSKLQDKSAGFTNR